MSEEDLPMMPLLVKDWIAATVHWTDAERGAYMSLLVFQWVNQNVPPDVSQLGRIMGTPPDQFESRWAVVGQKFDGDAKGLFNNRLEVHRKKAITLRDAHVRGAGSANAVRRAKRHAERGSTDVPRDDAQRDESATPTSTSTSLSEGDKSKSASLRSANAQRAPRGTPWNDDEWINFKLEYPHRSGGVAWERAKKAWKARLAEGHKWNELIEGAKRYCKYCDAANKTGTDYVMHASTFCGPDKGFTQEWDIPADGAHSERWTPEPDDPPEAA
jgi:uncharacterized protein YdaU (DUF1376 family)